MKKIMGLNGNSNSDMEELAKKTTDGDFAELANIMNEHADCLAAPLASIFNCSLREGVLPPCVEVS